MQNIRTILIIVVIGSAFAVGIIAGRRLKRRRAPHPRRPKPALSVPKPRSEKALAATLLRAVELYKQEDYPAAAAHYEACAQYKPEDAKLRIEAAWAYEAADMKYEALSHLLDVLKAHPGHAQAHYESARILATLGRGAYPQAFSQAQEAKRLGYPVPDALWRQLEELREENERAKREGRPTPDDPFAGMRRRPRGPDLP